MKAVLSLLALAVLVVAPEPNYSGSTPNYPGSTSSSTTTADASYNKPADAKYEAPTSGHGGYGTDAYGKQTYKKQKKGAGEECHFGHHDCAKGLRCVCKTSGKHLWWHLGKKGECQACPAKTGEGQECKPYHGECAKGLYCHRKHTKEEITKYKTGEYGYSKEYKVQKCITTGKCTKKGCHKREGEPCRKFKGECAKGLHCHVGHVGFHGICTARKTSYGKKGADYGKGNAAYSGSSNSGSSSGSSSSSSSSDSSSEDYGKDKKKDY